MKTLNKLEVQDTLKVGVLPTALTSNLSVLLENEGLFQKRTLGSIINKNENEYLPSFSSSFPDIFNFNTSTTYNNQELNVSLKNQIRNTVFAAPTNLNGTPAFRMLEDSDLSQTSLNNKANVNGNNLTNIADWRTNLGVYSTTQVNGFLAGKANTSGYYPGLSVGNATQWSGQIYNQGAIGNDINVFMTHNGSGWGYTSIPQVQSALGITTALNLNLQQVTQNGSSTNVPTFFDANLHFTGTEMFFKNNAGANGIYFSPSPDGGLGVHKHSNYGWTGTLGVIEYDSKRFNWKNTISLNSDGGALPALDIFTNEGGYIRSINNPSGQIYVIASGWEHKWYNTVWRVGNKRGGGSDSLGYSFEFNDVEKVIIEPNSNIRTQNFGSADVWNAKVSQSQLANYALSSQIPTNVSQLVNDAGYVTTAVTGFRSGTNPYQQGLINLQAGANITISQNSTTRVWTFSATDTNTITNIGANGVVGTSGDINFQGIGGTEIAKVGNTLNVSQSSLRTTFHNITATSTLPNDERDKEVQCNNTTGIVLTLPNGYRNGQVIAVNINTMGGGGAGAVNFSGQLYYKGSNMSTTGNVRGVFIFTWNSSTSRWWMRGNA